MFLLIAPTAVFYSLGYRIDFDSKKISQTGGLFLKVLPKQVEVYLVEGEHEGSHIPEIHYPELFSEFLASLV